MKNIISIVLLSFLQFSCKTPAPQSAVIEGTGVNPKIKKVYLTTAPEWDIFLDSAECVNGSFKLNYNPKEGFEPFLASICYLDSAGKITQLYVKNEEIIKRTKENSANSAFMLDYGKSKLKNFEEKYGRTIVALEGGRESTLFKAFEGKTVGYIKGPNDLHGFSRVLQQIDKEPASFFFLGDIIQYREQFSKNQLQQLLKTFDSKVQKSRTGRFLSEYIENIPNANDKPIDLSLRTMNGKVKTAINRTAKLNMLVFWASWCGPCRAEIPDLKKVRKAINNQDFFMAGISIDKNETAWKQAVNQEKLAWEQFVVDKNELNKIFSRYQFSSIPLVIFTDNQGKEVKRFSGYQPDNTPDYLKFINEYLSM